MWPCCHENLWLLSFGRSADDLTFWNYDNKPETRKRHDCRWSSNVRKTPLKGNSFVFVYPGQFLPTFGRSQQILDYYPSGLVSMHTNSSMQCFRSHLRHKFRHRLLTRQLNAFYLLTKLVWLQAGSITFLSLRGTTETYRKTEVIRKWCHALHHTGHK